MSATALRTDLEALYQQDAVPGGLDWYQHLSAHHQRLFAGELYTALESGKTDDELVELVDSWRATAELDASPALQEAIAKNLASNTWSGVPEWLKTRSTR